MEADRIRLKEPTVVLDASALLALLQGEPGAAAVRRRLGESVVSAVNWVEVVERRRAPHLPASHLEEAMRAAGLVIVPFTARQANATAELRPATRELGLSLADRACLALARLAELPALTTDAVWAKLDVDVEVELIR